MRRGGTGRTDGALFESARAESQGMQPMKEHQAQVLYSRHQASLRQSRVYSLEDRGGSGKALQEMESWSGGMQPRKVCN